MLRMLNATDLESLSEPQLREVTRDLQDQVQTLRSEVLFKRTRIEQLTYELARYKRIRFGHSSEKLDATQASLLDEALDADLAAIEEELEHFIHCVQNNRIVNNNYLNQSSGLLGAHVVRMLEIARKSVEEERTESVDLR